MERGFGPVTQAQKENALDFVQKVFSEYMDEREGLHVRKLVQEIRSKKYYLPELELMATDENNEIIGYAMLSRFHLENRYENELLLLSPVCVKTELQRRHISKELLEYGFEQARRMGYALVIVEGNPQNYRARGFVTAAQHGVLPGKTVHLPHIDCLMAMELAPNAFSRIRGTLEYSFYDALCGPQDEE